MSKTENIRNYLIGFTLDVFLDKYMDDSFQWRRLFFMFLILLISVFGVVETQSLFVRWIASILLCFILFFYLHSMNGFLLDLIDEKAKVYIDRLDTGDYDNIEKRINLGKDLLPLNWLLITAGLGLISGMVKVYGSNIFNIDCLLLNVSVYTLVILLLIIVPNYIFYSYSTNYIHKLKKNPKQYSVKIFDENDLLSESVIVVKY